MQLQVLAEIQEPTAVAINHHHLLTAIVYQFLGGSDTDFAQFLHDDGYGREGSSKRVKLFCFSSLRVPKSRRRIVGATLWLDPGTVEWRVASPNEPFLRHFAEGLLKAGSLTVGRQQMPIVQASILPDPDFSAGQAAFTCLTPVVASVQDSPGGAHYLTPVDRAAFSVAIRGNLLRKWEALHGAPFADADAAFEFDFDQEYIARATHGGTRLIDFKGIKVRGVQAPFRVKGSPDLIRLMYDCGAGEKNSAGFGMVQVDYRGAGA